MQEQIQQRNCNLQARSGLFKEMKQLQGIPEFWYRRAEGPFTAHIQLYWLHLPQILYNKQMVTPQISPQPWQFHLSLHAALFYLLKLDVKDLCNI